MLNNLWIKYTNPCVYWNVLLWDNILKDNSIFCVNINKYMFNNFCKNHCTEEQSDIIFTRISQGDTHINYKNFDTFLRLLKDSEYINIINTLIDDLSIINKHSVTKSISLVHDKIFKKSKFVQQLLNILINILNQKSK